MKAFHEALSPQRSQTALTDALSHLAHDHAVKHTIAESLSDHDHGGVASRPLLFVNDRRVGGADALAVSRWVSVLVAMTFQITAANQLRRDQQVKVGSEVVRIRCHGARRGSAPVVVLEAGAGNGADSWNQVFPAVAEFARVCAYDRPGFDAVGPDLQLGAPEAIVERLRRLLAAAGERPPYILAGHWLIARLYERTFRKEVAALVLVDPTLSGGHSRPSRRRCAKIARFRCWLARLRPGVGCKNPAVQPGRTRERHR